MRRFQKHDAKCISRPPRCARRLKLMTAIVYCKVVHLSDLQNTYSLVRSSLAPGLAILLLQAKSLPMASTNPMPNAPAVGAGYKAARSGRNGSVSGDIPADAPVDAPVDTPVDTPIDTAIVPSVPEGSRSGRLPPKMSGKVADSSEPTESKSEIGKKSRTPMNEVRTLPGVQIDLALEQSDHEKKTVPD